MRRDAQCGEAVAGQRELGGVRALLNVPLLKDGSAIGIFSIYRQAPGAFQGKHVALVEGFAAQAVIAMENARLINEQREALEQQIATSEVLQVINASPGNLTPVFDTMLDKAMQLCGVAFGVLYVFDNNQRSVASTRGLPRKYADYLAQNPTISDIPPVVRRLLETRRTSHLDTKYGEGYIAGHAAPRALVDLGGARTTLMVPLVKNDAVIAYFALFRQEVRPFAEKEIVLLESFAAQAVIAMDNARLLTEQKEALDRQTATAEVLQVINASPGNLAPVFAVILEKAHLLCGAERGSLQLRDGEMFRAVATRGHGELRDVELRQGFTLDHQSALRQAMPWDKVAQVEDLPALLAQYPDDSDLKNIVAGGMKSLLAVPLIKDGVLLGRIVGARREAPAFSDSQIALLESFAAQGVIAMDNARLLNEISAARDTAEVTLRDLKMAQANLIQAEKMASLGQLTAGIAHEIKNPLNFVNNFSDLSVELLAELREIISPALDTLDKDMRADADDLADTLTSNLQKITEHGKRADGIVRSMLEHSRGASGERRAVDLNDLVEEALNLAYHGARAQDQSFNITLERDYAPSLAPITLNPQDITRVFLNLFSNGFYAANQRAKTETSAPALKVTTRDLGDTVEIRVRDNGTGIPPDIRDKLFQPFFTTKPTGEGTGLGLSITYDVVTQQHGGSIAVDSDVGAYTEFTVTLPRTNAGVSP